ncbi:hypothetical protein PACTADRAFT_48717 [Pachysolen tannophilus NRRL Y-2460]|uniref:Uncharacterized protein n=1 Tax=Pachysolen tannophilus NRRL Y-2460 TaxID=669874 RepID=A0A1E4TYV9_PACTA|nr:hypothetical protein PACTADRAFT_48717 [Pachysolen tannophilus NRRL Y-2460]
MSGKRMVLNPENSNEVAIKGVIFDMDGTLCLPQPWMFKMMRQALKIEGLPIDILDYIDSLSEDEKIIANKALADIEAKAMIEQVPQPGLEDLMKFLHENDLPKTICTRNLIEPVNHLVSKFLPSEIQLQDPIITRSYSPPKPSAKPLLHIIESWGLKPENVIMVGDSSDDMMAGLNAGCSVILIEHENNIYLKKSLKEIDVAVNRLDDIIDLIKNGYALADKSQYDPAKILNRYH